MRFIQTVLIRIKDYFTANTGRKIFFFGLLASILSLILYFIVRYQVIFILMMLAIVVASFGTLWDSMAARYYFLKKIREIQYDHLKEINDKQNAGEDVAITPTFSVEEKRYLRRRKWHFVFVIILKVALMIALFSLLLKTQMS